ncbi:AIPR family protein [Micromonospora sp. NPDC048909]|uniref:AIPR family protein n=1 Tax=Micromonospora sp. NPDC048909 TaxID=3155643 RepID=UPI0033CEB979
MSAPLQENRQLDIIQASLLRDFEPFLDTSAFTHPDPAQRVANVASRALAGAVVRDRLGCATERAATMVTDGGQDFGIDALAISDGAPRVWLIQSKWSSKGAARFGEVDVMTMADGLHRIDQRNFDRFNARLLTHRAQLEAIWQDKHLRVTLVLVLMRRDPLHDNVITRLDEVRDRFNTLGNYLDYEVLYVPDIWEMIRRGGEPASIDISIRLDRWFDISTPMRAVNGIVDAAQVAEWYSQHGDSLFQRNIRESLGVTQVNADIQRTLVEEPHTFWYRNNGLTMLCDTIKVTPLSRIEPYGPATVDVRGASIINGAQTVAAIASAMRADSAAAGRAAVGIRIIESDHPEVSDEITRATNTQNRVELRDFVALKSEQVAIREDFRLTLGLTYAIRRSELEPSPESGCTVREAALALACTLTTPDLIARVRQNEDLLWEDGPSGAYRRLFKGQPPALQIWRSVLFVREVRDSLHKISGELEGRAAAIATQSMLVVAHIAFTQLGRDGVDDPDVDWDAVLHEVHGLTFRVVQWLISEVDQRYGKNSFITGTFASVDRVRSLVGGVRDALDAGQDAPELEPEYQPIPRQRRPRRRNTVALLVDAGRIKDGSRLTFRPRTRPERAALTPWLAGDSRRGVATWVNNRTKPLVWSVDGKGYSPSGLVMKMYDLAEWDGAPVAVQGPSRWHLGEEGSLLRMASEVRAESPVEDDEDSVVDVDVDALLDAVDDELKNGGQA